MIDRESAFEILDEKLAKKQAEEERIKQEEAIRKEQIKKDQDESRALRQQKRNKSELEKQLGRMTNSALNSMSRSLGTKIMRGILGSIFGGK